MAARGNEAKEWITQKIIECFGQEQSFVSDKKIYINTREGGESVQVCLTLTCPKVPVGGGTTPTVSKSAFNAGIDFESMGLAKAEPVAFTPAEITDKEKETVAELMRRLGL